MGKQADKKKKGVPSTIATGGFGVHFEHRMQAFFAVLMLCGEEIKILPDKKIIRLEFQTKPSGYNTDDLLIVLKDSAGAESRVLVQIKSSISFIKSDADFVKTIGDGWTDFVKNLSSRHASEVQLLVTGPLSKKDTNLLGLICERARNIPPDRFGVLYRVGVSVSKDQKTLYDIIKSIVEAKIGQKVLDEDLAKFLKQLYHLQPDSPYGGCLVESFANALMNKTFDRNCKGVLDTIIRIMAEGNATGGVLSKEELEDRLEREYGQSFKSCSSCENAFAGSDQSAGAGAVAPGESTLQCLTAESNVNGNNPQAPSVERNLGLKKVVGGIERKDKLALLCLIGSWSEACQTDMVLSERVLGFSESDFNQYVHQLEDLEIVKSKEGISHVVFRRKIWRLTAKSLSRLEIKRFLDCVKLELLKINKSFNVPTGPDTSVTFNSRSDFASQVLREGISRGIAMLSVDNRFCERLGFDGRIQLGAKFIKSLFSNSDWRTWASLDDELSFLAEVDPEAFLLNVRRFLAKRKGGLEELYRTEADDIFSAPHFTGLVNALGSLAWFHDWLADVVDVLGEMARRDPDGRWQPRPLDKLRYILHPYAPHTWAKKSRRVSVVKGVCRRLDDTTRWKLLEVLQPTQTYSYFVSDVTPLFRAKGRTGQVEKRDRREIWAELDEYCSLAINAAGLNSERIGKLANAAIENWTATPFQSLVGYIGRVFDDLDNDARFEVWQSIRSAIYYASMRNKGDSRSASLQGRIDAYIKLEEQYKPDDLFYAGRVLFSWRQELYDKRLNELSDDEIRLRQQAIVAELHRSKGSVTTLNFAIKTDKAWDVGCLLGGIASADDDLEVLPLLHTGEDNRLSWAVKGYVSGRFEKDGWNWVNSVDTSKWKHEVVADFLSLLPFRKDVWQKLKEFLGDDTVEYWKRIVHPYVHDIRDLQAAVDGLLGAKCGYVALNLVAGFVILGNEDIQREASKVMRAFIYGSVSDKPTSTSSYNIEAVVKYVQKANVLSKDEKAAVEWMFIDLADWHGGHGFTPLYIGAKLAQDPNYFIEAVKIVYLPEKRASEIKAERARNPISPEEQHRIENVWRLLEYPSVAPGVDENGVFHDRAFDKWARGLLSFARKEDRRSSVQGVMGRMFRLAIGKGDDFWLPHEIAKLMEKRGNERMLRSLAAAMFNSRGVHDVDQTGKQDELLARDYLKKAEGAEEHGYKGLAEQMRHIAKWILDDAGRMKSENRSLDAYFEVNKDELTQNREEYDQDVDDIVIED